MKRLKGEEIEILFYGPFGNNIPAERAGGAEAGCRRSVDLLKKHKFFVHVVEKPTLFYGVTRFFRDYIKAVIHIRHRLAGNRGILFYLVGFYGRQLPFESFLCLLAKSYGCRLIYEPKNGMLVKKYKEGGWLYRKLSDYIFRNSACILCQGIEYKKFLEECGYGCAVYHPNYIAAQQLSLVRRKEKAGRVFLYFGRVTPSKRVDLCIEIFREFHENMENSEFYIIGGAETDYLERLRKQAASGGIGEKVHFTGRLPFTEIAGYLNQADYFLFPTEEVFEGHSNSLTEAMAFGVVPIASSAGFNRTVIGDDTLIVETQKALDYLNIINEIEEKGSWHKYSEYVGRRAREHFSEDVVKKQYLDVIQKLVPLHGVYTGDE